MSFKSVLVFAFLVGATTPVAAQPAALPATEVVVGEPSVSCSDTSGTPCPTSVWRSAFRNAGDKEGRREYRRVMAQAQDRFGQQSTFAAFHAVAEILAATHKWFPISKLTGFRKWTRTLDEHAERSPVDPDIRLLRLTVQANAPGFLGYHEELPEDCLLVHLALENRFWTDDPEHDGFVRSFHEQSEACN